MCGRYELPNTPKSWRELRELLGIPDGTPQGEFGSTEVRPTNSVPIAANDATHDWSTGKWWLDGPWSSGGKKLTLINARDDKLDGRFWRKMVETQRCAVPAASFYEWRPVQGAKKKQRVRIGMKDDSPFLMAGLWNRWNGALTFTLLTTSGNETMRGIHDRMPVILTRESLSTWLAPEPMALDELRPIIGPFDPAGMVAVDSAESIEPPAKEPDRELFGLPAR